MDATTTQDFITTVSNAWIFALALLFLLVFFGRGR